MAREVQEFQVTVPAGTAIDAPQITSIAVPPRMVSRITWRVPRGPAGNLGFLISMGGVPVLPLPTGTYVIADGESGSWSVEDLPDSGAWQVTAYNTGAFNHSVYLDLFCDLIGLDDTLEPLIAPWTLADAPDLSHAGPTVGRRS